MTPPKREMKKRERELGVLTLFKQYGIKLIKLEKQEKENKNNETKEERPPRDLLPVCR